MSLKSELIRAIARDDSAEDFVRILLGMDAAELQAPLDPEFESVHPRGPGGQFSSKGGSATQTPAFKGKVTTGSKHTVKGLANEIAKYEKTGRIKRSAYNALEKKINELERMAKTSVKKRTTINKTTGTTEKTGTRKTKNGTNEFRDIRSLEKNVPIEEIYNETIEVPKEDNPINRRLQ